MHINCIVRIKRILLCKGSFYETFNDIIAEVTTSGGWVTSVNPYFSILMAIRNFVLYSYPKI